MAFQGQDRMERAGRILSRLKAARGSLSAAELVAAAWPTAVGHRLAAHTRVVGVQNGRVIAEAEDAIWQQNLSGLSAQILANLGRLLQADAPREIEFRIGARRRPVRRAEPAREAGLFGRESSGIADPELDYLYRQSRRKAGA
jgi:predicted nucleic acid-binding Zn ribbon protein